MHSAPTTANNGFKIAQRRGHPPLSRRFEAAPRGSQQHRGSGLAFRLWEVILARTLLLAAAIVWSRAFHTHWSSRSEPPVPATSAADR